MLRGNGRIAVENNASNSMSDQMDASICWMNGLTLKAIEKVLFPFRKAITTAKRHPASQGDPVVTRVNMVNPEPSAV